MTTDSTASQDKQHQVYARFNQNLRTKIRALISDELIEEHRRNPLGQHSDALERVLNFFRRPPTYALYAEQAFEKYRVIKVPVTPGASPEPISEDVFRSEHDAAHAVFLLHVESLKEGSES